MQSRSILTAAKRPLSSLDFQKTFLWSSAQQVLETLATPPNNTDFIRNIRKPTAKFAFLKLQASYPEALQAMTKALKASVHGGASINILETTSMEVSPFGGTTMFQRKGLVQVPDSEEWESRLAELAHRYDCDISMDLRYA